MHCTHTSTTCAQGRTGPSCRVGNSLLCPVLVAGCRHRRAPTPSRPQHLLACGDGLEPLVHCIAQVGQVAAAVGQQVCDQHMVP